MRTAAASLTQSELALHDEKRSLLNRLAEIRRLETRHPLLSDERIAELREDRSGLALCGYSGPVEELTWQEQLSALDELAAWRRHKLTDAEKEALGRLVSWLTDQQHAEHAAAVGAIQRIAPQRKGETR